MSELRISTAVYTGPLDLLLFLVRRTEVDVFDLPVAEIADQYIAELEKMERVDLNFAGEYLVLAAQLLKLKSEMVLHLAEKGEDGHDPRQSLVKQLLEYRRYRDLGQQLEDIQTASLRSHSRPEGLVPEAEREDLFLDEVSAVDLYRVYSRLMREVTADKPHQILMTDRPIEEYIQLILDELLKGNAIDFRALLMRGRKREDAIGNFLAVLEMVKQQKVAIVEDDGVLKLTTPTESSENDTGDEALEA